VKLSEMKQKPLSTRKRIAATIALSYLTSGAIGAVLLINPTTLIDWRTSPLDLNLRGFNGERFRFICPLGKVPAGQPVGSGPYTDSSSICAAAAHAGVIHPSAGGSVLIEIRPGQTHFVGSLSNYVQSTQYEAYWDGSFVVATGELH
jgi:LCCL domain